MADMTKTLTLLGSSIHDIPSFYAEINRVFMAGEDWALGHSLDALDDMLYGGYGAIRSKEPIRLVWQGLAQSRASLGLSATRTFLNEKLKQPEVFNVAHIRTQLDALERGVGKTYFEIVMDIFAAHPTIEVVAE
ncbi:MULTISPECIES: barstar family protein [Pseudomonas]|nr:MULTISPECIES: barstar family protein [Pseudomonas]